MSASVTGYLTSSQYTFPVYDSTVEANPQIPKDLLLSHSLRLERTVPISHPIRSNIPLNNVLSSKDGSDFENPLSDLLQFSRAKIERYIQNSQNIKPVPPPIKTNSITISKRQEVGRTTPITNKTIFFSPSGKGKIVSTPVSKRKSSMNLKQKLLKMDSASLVNMTKPQPPMSSSLWFHNDNKFKDESFTNDQEDSDYDHLACHADNIMRMAVDSTMLGSTFNSSFSSSFSNSFMAENTGKDFFDKEAKQAILEGLNF
ncbi:hypothetical protein PSN45_001978 [Yamadazyma tenuis]|uniref:Uncharacterized protein n=1 Tax=Candida tenuis (strain ATCC 10573 / BCRC 21748 / CBS 615 / JCM 9827 / NBRC 10315 / NRRL Y-1498 / VKM Y-70) TaxID=590646 RepID=G3BD86_CANTC|nr:uncharacterized protein CANTEDRAFT_116326 [Yamadazyma tenuis ATCC 10573]EGV60268.1 hypothetical protein CANTEDRAFT_116326 [Yamadazyma tenuis ATCC 10573]WEJ94492.1 hypothetical protein PSN45_001978 [Yamadazyma tenuis]